MSVHKRTTFIAHGMIASCRFTRFTASIRVARALLLRPRNTFSKFSHVNESLDEFLADRANGRAIATLLRLSVRPSVCDVMYCG